MEYRYFYEEGYHPQVRTIGGFYLNDRGKFIRTKLLIEVTKEGYERILADEAKIAERKKQMGLEDTSHHNPMKITDSELRKMINELNYKIR